MEPIKKMSWISGGTIWGLIALMGIGLVWAGCRDGSSPPSNFLSAGMLRPGQAFEVLASAEQDDCYYAIILLRGRGILALRFENPPPQRGVVTTEGEILPLSEGETVEP